MTANEVHKNADKPGRNEWKVLVVLALFSLLMEAGVRCFAGSLSLDLRNTLATPKTAERFARASGEVRTVLVVGNSLARCGVDLALLSRDASWSQGWEEDGIEVELFAPDASSVVQWNWGLRRYFANTGSHPDVILLFTGRTHLLESSTSPETLGAYYIGTSDLGEAFKSMQGNEDSIHLLLGATSHLLANRDRVRTRIGYSYLPGFEIAWPTLTAGSDAGSEATDRQPKIASTESLERFITTAREMGSDLYVFGVPMPEPYLLPEPVIQLLEKYQVPLHNLSSVPGIEVTNFPDDYHLDESGAQTFTQALIRILNKQSE
jgi:hypothetical protein